MLPPPVHNPPLFMYLNLRRSNGDELQFLMTNKSSRSQYFAGGTNLNLLKPTGHVMHQQF